MDLKRLFSLGSGPEPATQLRSEFDVKIERKVRGTVMHFDARVHGHFVPKGGKAEFVADGIFVKGIPGVNMRDQFPGELKEVQEYALSVEYPKALARKLR